MEERREGDTEAEKKEERAKHEKGCESEEMIISKRKFRYISKRAIMDQGDVAGAE